MAEDEGRKVTVVKASGYVLKNIFLVMTIDGQEYHFPASERDINKSLKENPLLIPHLKAILLCRFYDRIYHQIETAEGKTINLIPKEPIDLSPRFFFPGMGEVVTLEELGRKGDIESMMLAGRMVLHRMQTAFKTHDNGLIAVEPGDRILNESEIEDFGQKPKSATAEEAPLVEDPVPEVAEDKSEAEETTPAEKPDKKHLN